MTADVLKCSINLETAVISWQRPSVILQIQRLHSWGKKFKFFFLISLYSLYNTCIYIRSFLIKKKSPHLFNDPQICNRSFLSQNKNFLINWTTLGHITPPSFVKCPLSYWITLVKKRTLQPKFKSYVRLLVFHIALILKCKSNYSLSS